MNILLQGYLDRNFGDDLMLRLAAYYLPAHRFFIKESRKELLLPFKNDENIFDADDFINITYDAVLRVTGSGFTIRDRVGLMYAMTENLRPKRIKSAVIGCNIGPFYSRLAAKVSNLEIKKYGLVTVRDRASREYLDKNIKGINAGYFPDILFSIPDEWLFPNTGEGCLGISAYRRAGVNNFDFYLKIAQAADGFIEAKNRNVLIFAFDIDRENDTAAAHTIQGLIKNKDKTEIVLHDDNGENILKNFARCGSVIAVRYHSAVLALRMGLDLIPVIYSEKTRNLLSDIGFTGDTYDIDNINSEKILNGLEEEHEPFAADHALFVKAKGHAERFEDWINET